MYWQTQAKVQPVVKVVIVCPQSFHWPSQPQLKTTATVSSLPPDGSPLCQFVYTNGLPSDHLKEETPVGAVRHDCKSAHGLWEARLSGPWQYWQQAVQFLLGPCIQAIQEPASCAV